MENAQIALKVFARNTPTGHPVYKHSYWATQVLTTYTKIWIQNNKKEHEISYLKRFKPKIKVDVTQGDFKLLYLLILFSHYLQPAIFFLEEKSFGNRLHEENNKYTLV